jgi:hypothetical protein
MVSTPLSWAGLAILVIALVLAAVITPALALLALVGLAVIWIAQQRTGTITSYTHHGAGHDGFGGRGADGPREGF